MSRYLRQRSSGAAAPKAANGGGRAGGQAFKTPRGNYGLPRGMVRIGKPSYVFRGVPRFGGAAFFSPLGLAASAAALAISAAIGNQHLLGAQHGHYDTTGWENVNGCYLTNIWARNADATSGTCGASSFRSRSTWNNHLGVFTSVSPYKVMDFAGDAWDIGPNTVGYTRGASWRSPRDLGSDADQKPMRYVPRRPARPVPEPYMGKNAGRQVTLDPAFYPPLANRPMPWPLSRPDLKSPPSPYRQDMQRIARTPKRVRNPVKLPSFIGEYTPPNSAKPLDPIQDPSSGKNFAPRIRYRQGSHLLKKPPRSTKETKIKVNTRSAGMRILAGVTEVLDIINLFYEVLPDGYKTKPFGATPQQKLRDIYDHFDYFSSTAVMDEVIAGFVVMELEDRNWALLGKMGAETSIALDRHYGFGINSISAAISDYWSRVQRKREKEKEK